jgi:hypothetical protein
VLGSTSFSLHFSAGDKNAHEAGFHFGQFLYFLATNLFFTLLDGNTLSFETLRSLLKDLRECFRTPVLALLSFCSISVLLFLIYRFR